MIDSFPIPRSCESISDQDFLGGLIRDTYIYYTYYII